MNKLQAIPVKVIDAQPPEASAGNAFAILNEIASLLERFVATGEGGMVDLRSLPLAPGDHERLQATLGAGEVEATVQAIGVTRVRETAVGGVWWVAHLNAEGDLLTELIEVCRVPGILRTHPDDARAGYERLRAQLAAMQDDAHAT